MSTSKKSKKQKPVKSERHQKAALAGIAKRIADGTYTEHQKFARSKLPREASMRGSKKGAKRVIEKYGAGALMKFARKWRLEHPSGPERNLLHILTSLSCVETKRDDYGDPENTETLAFIREDTCGDYLLDVYFPVLHCAVEVDGKPSEWSDDQRLDFEIRRLRWITDSGIKVMQLRGEDLVRPGIKEEIESFLWLYRSARKPGERTYTRVDTPPVTFPDGIPGSVMRVGKNEDLDEAPF